MGNDLLCRLVLDAEWSRILISTVQAGITIWYFTPCEKDANSASRQNACGGIAKLRHNIASCAIPAIIYDESPPGVLLCDHSIVCCLLLDGMELKTESMQGLAEKQAKGRSAMICSVPYTRTCCEI